MIFVMKRFYLNIWNIYDELHSLLLNSVVKQACNNKYKILNRPFRVKSERFRLSFFPISDSGITYSVSLRVYQSKPIFQYDEQELSIEHWHSAMMRSWLTIFLGFFLPGTSTKIFKGVTVFFAQAFIQPSNWFFAAQKPSQRPISMFPLESKIIFSQSSWST